MCVPGGECPGADLAQELLLVAVHVVQVLPQVVAVARDEGALGGKSIGHLSPRIVQKTGPRYHLKRIHVQPLRVCAKIGPAYTGKFHIEWPTEFPLKGGPQILERGYGIVTLGFCSVDSAWFLGHFAACYSGQHQIENIAV